ncbi:MAG: hypothetical protein R3A45_03790 [Bdellovibrionota bacterium]
MFISNFQAYLPKQQTKKWDFEQFVIEKDVNCYNWDCIAFMDDDDLMILSTKE